jgi:hypothetical protein
MAIYMIGYDLHPSKDENYDKLFTASRVKDFAKPTGIDVPEADIPPSMHVIRADVKDKDGRSGSLIFKLNVAKH